MNNASGFGKMGVMKNQFNALENPKENSFEKQSWWGELYWFVTVFLLDILKNSWS